MHYFGRNSALPHIFVTFFKETEVKKGFLYIVILFIIYFLFLLFSTGKTLWTDENRMKMKQNDGEKSACIQILCLTWRRRCYGLGLYGCSGAGSLVIYDDLTANRNSRMKCDVYRLLHSFTAEQMIITQSKLQKQPESISTQRNGVFFEVFMRETAGGKNS